MNERIQVTPVTRRSYPIVQEVAFSDTAEFQYAESNRRICNNLRTNRLLVR